MKNNFLKYENIIFDLGGVVLTLDYQKTIDEFSKLIGTDFKDFYSQYQQLAFFDQYERGEITSDQFRNEIRKAFNINSNNEEIDYAWNAMLGIIPDDRIELLLKLKENKRTFLLSNTNAIHLKRFNQIAKSNNNLNGLSSLFEKDYYSHLVGMRKPEKRIFKYVLNENNLKAEETLFIDDSIQHIEGAKQLGINSYLLDKNDSIISVFEK